MRKLKLIISLAIPLSVGFIGSLFTNPAIKDGWYETLKKPALVPPSWVFPVVWTILFILMGLALYLVWQKSGKKIRAQDKHLAFLLFAGPLLLNIWWSILFFYVQRPSWALLEIVPLWLAILATIFVFEKIDRRAGWLLWPYLLWVSFAVYLNNAIALG
jgi:tryptophan-rich sensory protein